MQTKQVPFQPFAHAGLVTIRLQPAERTIAVRLLENGELVQAPAVVRVQQLEHHSEARRVGSAWEVATTEGEVTLRVMPIQEIVFSRINVLAQVPGYAVRPSIIMVRPEDEVISFEVTRMCVLRLTIEGAEGVRNRSPLGMVALSSPFAAVSPDLRNTEQDIRRFELDTEFPLELRVVAGTYSLPVSTLAGQVHPAQLEISGDMEKTIRLGEPFEIHSYQLQIANDWSDEDLVDAYVVTGPFVLQALHSARGAALGNRRYTRNRGPRDPVHEAAFYFAQLGGASPSRSRRITALSCQRLRPSGSSCCRVTGCFRWTSTMVPAPRVPTSPAGVA